MSAAAWPARAWLLTFVGAIAICGALSIEAWPFTSWRLFSRERREIATGWMATSVDARGRERRVRFERFAKPDRYFVSVMSTFHRLEPEAQEATCRAWTRLVRRDGGSAARGLRLYATTRDMRLHVGRRAAVKPVARLRWRCGDGRGVRAVAGTGP